MNITIPDGRTLNVSTPEGSAAFLEWGPDVITRNIGGGVRLEAQPIAANKQTFLIFGCLAAHLPAAARSGVATAEKRALVDLAKRWCEAPPRSPRWAIAGVLAEDVQELLDCLTPWSNDAEFCALLLEGAGTGCLGAYAALCGRCAVSPPAGFLESLIMVSHNCALNVREQGGSGGIKAVAAAGVLPHIFSACAAACDAALPPPAAASSSGAMARAEAERLCGTALGFVVLVHEDPRFVRKGLRSGGDERGDEGSTTGGGGGGAALAALKAAVASIAAADRQAAAAAPGAAPGNKGATARLLQVAAAPPPPRNLPRRSPPCRDALADSLKKLVMQADYSSAPKDTTLVLQLCRGCSKESSPGQTLLRCSRCRAAKYCDAACQRLDWRRHKAECRRPEECASDPATHRRSVDSESTTNAAQRFVGDHALAIRAELRAVAQASRAGAPGAPSPLRQLRDLVVVVDFQAGAVQVQVQAAQRSGSERDTHTHSAPCAQDPRSSELEVPGATLGAPWCYRGAPLLATSLVVTARDFRS